MIKTVGIMGGMGPLATVDLMDKIIRLTPAQNDQDHIHMIVDNYPQIPDRTSAIMGKGNDPLPFMKQSAKRLEDAGADLIVIACNTAHYYLQDIQETVRAPIVNMPKETASFIDEAGIRRVSLLATDGTLKTLLYQNALHEKGITVLEPDEITQAIVMEGIYSVKAGHIEKGKRLLVNAFQTMIAKGTEAVVAACTEIPIVLNEVDGIKVIDPTYILAKRVVDVAYREHVL
ncbi:aspartate/glutamate racemase family protein [Paenibacillus kribbensis]|uniref:aspartate/glutamate racemase family protein n=1 Tax=Paenibacillus kribbensis TaxID=172713 RepID=UPI0008396872|nr:amino acid racemase [Paenibacillus kribbensis]